MSDSKPKVLDTIRSMTGFDEIAVEQRFHKNIQDIESESMMARALIFVLERRNGKDDKTAYGEAMRLTVGDLQSYFEKEDDEEELNEGEA